MLHRLRRGNQRGVENSFVGNAASAVVGFLDDAVNRGTGGASQFLTTHLEDLVQSLDLAFVSLR